LPSLGDAGIHSPGGGPASTNSNEAAGSARFLRDKKDHTGMNALELFRTGRDYIEISAILGISVPSVETEIHRLRSVEKGDTTGQDHAGAAMRRFPHRIKPGTPVNFFGGQRRRV
jgi:DNA-binding CsgD family transcriptional regulator